MLNLANNQENANKATAMVLSPGGGKTRRGGEGKTAVGRVYD